MLKQAFNLPDTQRDEPDTIMTACKDRLRALVTLFVTAQRKPDITHVRKTRDNNDPSVKQSIIDGIQRLVRGLPREMRNELLTSVPDIPRGLVGVFALLKWEITANMTPLTITEADISRRDARKAVLTAIRASNQKKPD